MGEINFAVLKINGKSIQKLSKDEALQAFMSRNPFHIEIQQCKALENNVGSNSKSFVLSFRCTELQNKKSQQSQTVLSIDSVNQRIKQPEEEDVHGHNTAKADQERLIEEEHVLFDQCLAPEIDIEEVTLRKSSSNEQLGLSIIYSGAPDGASSKTNSGGSNNGATTNSTIGSGSEYNNETCTEVFISHIQTDSVAWRDGRLRQGDQILQINGKEIKTKEETETLIAENNNAVTLLVSRYLYTDEDDFNDPSLVVDLEEVEVDDDDENDETDDDDEDEDGRAEGGLYTDSNLAYENCPNVKENLNLISNLKKDIIENENTCLPIGTTINENSTEVIDKLDATLCMGISACDNKEQILISETCRKYLRNMTKTLTERQEKSLKGRNDNITHSILESDTEHIYETIPEDSESEPFYCSPYESSTYVNAVGTCSSSTSINGNGEAFHLQQRQKQRVAQWLGLMHPGSASVTVHQHHEPEDNNSSSAYNTGGSNASAQQQQQQLGVIAVPRNNLPDENFLTHASYNKRFQKPKIKSNQNLTGFNTAGPNLNTAGSMPRMGCEEFSIPDTLIRMYPPLTPITGNQQMSSKKLSNRETAPRICNKAQNADQLPRTVSMLCPHFNAPNLRQYHFVSSQEVSTSHLNASNLDASKTQSLSKQIESTQQKQQQQQQQPSMVWKVKRRPDGTRYIVRRPAAAANTPSNEPSTSVLVGRNRILRNSEHVRNDFTTTEDDTISEVKTGRYWSKEERKKHVERARERRQQQQQHQQQQLIEAATTIRISDKMVARLQQYRKQRQKQQLSTVKIQHQDLQFGGGGTETNLKKSCELQSTGVSINTKIMTPNAISKINTLQSQQLPQPQQQQLHFINSHVQGDGLTTASLIPIEDINPNENCSSP